MLALAFLAGAPATLLTAAQKQSRRPSPPIRIAFVGDVIFEAPWRNPPPPPHQLLEGVQASFAEEDLVVCNLEEPLTAWSQQTPHKDPAAVEAGRDFIFRAASPDVGRALRQAGIQVAALANNHTMDYTERGLLDTLAQLSAADVVPVGGGENLAAAEQVKVVHVKGRRIGFLAFSDVVPPYFWAEEDQPGIASAKEAVRVREAIRRARHQADLLVVIFHWGQQLARDPSSRQGLLAREARRAGADLILGSHPHVLQGIGCIGRAPVVYSAGNFVFPTRRAVSQRSAIFEFEISGRRISSVRVVPVLLDEQGAPHLAEESLRTEILSEMDQLSSPLGMHFAGDRAVCGKVPGGKPTRSVSRPPSP